MPICANCGNDFKKSKLHPKQKNCNKKCARELRERKAKGVLLCRLCDNEIPVPKRHLFCSSSCMIRSKNKKMYAKNADKNKAQAKLYVERNRLKVAQRRKLYYENNKSKVINQVRKNYLIRNAEVLLKNKLAREEAKKTQKERLLAYRRKYYSGFRALLKNIGREFNRSLKKDRATNKYFQLFGYSKDQLKQHLEKQFKEGMNWDNYGKWHLDHKIPQSWFYKKKDEILDIEILKECWSLNNLQPLWANDNFKKGARYAG